MLTDSWEVLPLNILFFLTPKIEVAYLDANYSLRQAMEKMEYHKYSAIPILNEDGEYIGTITEGDILWYLRHGDKEDFLKWLESVPLADVPRRYDNEPVNASSNMEDLISKIVNQNFVPVVDDCDRFIGIITRKDVIQYFCDRQ